MPERQTCKSEIPTPTPIQSVMNSIRNEIEILDCSIVTLSEKIQPIMLLATDVETGKEIAPQPNVPHSTHVSELESMNSLIRILRFKIDALVRDIEL